ncbi:MAG: hypothetical protein JRJ41_03395 [Deltaproteobacteria bacterium]|nr:hypothetical protein [Deltaproteobacteria bacterium]
MGVKGLDTTKDCAGHKKISEKPSPQTNLETAKKNFLDIKALVIRRIGAQIWFRFG